MPPPGLHWPRVPREASLGAPVLPAAWDAAPALPSLSLDLAPLWSWGVAHPCRWWGQEAPRRNPADLPVTVPLPCLLFLLEVCPPTALEESPSRCQKENHEAIMVPLCYGAVRPDLLLSPTALSTPSGM